jgi:hypothetical protein
LLVIEDDAELTFVKVQSSKLCCITIIVDARDNEHLYEEVLMTIISRVKVSELKVFLNCISAQS